MGGGLESSSTSPGFVDERGEDTSADVGILGPLRVPLDADHVASFRTTDGFDHPVSGTGDDLEGSGILEGLSMVAVDQALKSSSFDGMDGAVTMVLGGGEGFWQMLIQMAARMEAHQLHAQAHPEGWKVGVRFLEQLEDFKFEGLPIGIDQGGLGMHGGSEGRGVGIVSATQDDRIQSLQNRRGGTGNRGERNPDRSAGLKLSQVGATEPDLVVHQIGRHADERRSIECGKRGVHTKAPGRSWRRAGIRHDWQPDTDLRFEALPASRTGLRRV